MIVRELITRASFEIDNGSLAKYDALLTRFINKFSNKTITITPVVRPPTVVQPRPGPSTPAPSVNPFPANPGGAGGGVVPTGINALPTLAQSALATAAGIGLYRAANFLGGAVTGLVEGFINGADKMTNTMNQLTASTGNAAEANRVMEKLYGTSTQTGVALENSARTYTRFAMATKAAGGTNDQAAELVDTVQKGLLISGATASETASVVTQLGQAIGSATLQGDELRSLLENGGTLTELLAKHLGTTTDKLKKLGSEGKLTRDKVVKALLEAGTEVRAMFANFVPTLEISRSIAKVRAMRLAADLDGALGITRMLSRGVLGIGMLMEYIRAKAVPSIKYFVESFGGIENLLWAIGAAFGVAFGPSILGLVYSLTAGILTMNAATTGFIARLLFIPALIAGIVLAIQDVMTWMKGGDSLAGDFLGPFEQFKQKISSIFTGTKEDVEAAFEPGPLRDFLISVNAVKGPVTELGGLFLGLHRFIVDNFSNANLFANTIREVQTIADSIRYLLNLAERAGKFVDGYIPDFMRPNRSSIVQRAPDDTTPRYGEPGYVSEADRFIARIAPYGDRAGQRYNPLSAASRDEDRPLPDGIRFETVPEPRPRPAVPQLTPRASINGQDRPLVPSATPMGQTLLRFEARPTFNTPTTVNVYATDTSAPAIAAGASQGVRQGNEANRSEMERLSRDVGSAVSAYQ